MTKIKDDMILSHCEKGIQIGTIVDVPTSKLEKCYSRADTKTLEIESIDGDMCIGVDSDKYKYSFNINDATINIENVGVNPFDNIVDWDCKMTSLTPGISEFFNKKCEESFDKKSKVVMRVYKYNFNPCVTTKSGKDLFFQRSYIWTAEQKKDFIRAIFHNYDCGKIVVRYNTEKKMLFYNKTFGFCADFDVIDGKQRLSTINEYINDMFDVDGVFYSDLSVIAKRLFDMRNCITMLVMNDSSTDEDVIRAFVAVNKKGTPMPISLVERIEKKFNE